jgi:hypothetical protein
LLRRKFGSADTNGSSAVSPLCTLSSSTFCGSTRPEYATMSVISMSRSSAAGRLTITLF